MKKKINIQLYVVALLSIVLTAVFSMLVYYNLFKKQVMEDLKSHTTIIKAMDVVHEKEDGTIQLSGLDNEKNVRITVIKKDGQVLYDNNTDISKMANHNDRPEIVEARKKGTGQSIRRSDTLGKDTFYYAVTLDNGVILRGAKDVSSVMSFFSGSFILLIVIAIAVFLLTIVLSRVFTKSIIRPIETMSEHMNEIDQYVAYDELVPFAKTIQKQHNKLLVQMKKLELENNKIQMITEHMEEGLILLDRNKNVMLANPSSRELLSCHGTYEVGENLWELSRNEVLNECIELALKGERQEIDFDVWDKRIRAFANPVYEEKRIVGAICFLLDITQMLANEKMRQEFTANVSHELKTPLTVISGYAELIEQEIAPKEDIKRFAGEIHQSSERLLILINDIIKLSELDEPKTMADFTSLELSSMAEHCVNSLEYKAKKHHVTLTSHLEKARMKGDYVMIEELLYNLCDNAIRYNREGGTVDVSVQGSNQTVELIVKDTGIGIPEQFQERIFERFFRVDKSRSKATKGTGLGLAIVKHIVLQHYGTIKVESKEDEGTKIIVTFPAE